MNERLEKEEKFRLGLLRTKSTTEYGLKHMGFPTPEASVLVSARVLIRA
jgi:hypothetical protein